MIYNDSLFVELLLYFIKFFGYSFFYFFDYISYVSKSLLKTLFSLSYLLIISYSLLNFCPKYKLEDYFANIIIFKLFLFRHLTF